MTKRNSLLLLSLSAITVLLFSGCGGDSPKEEKTELLTGKRVAIPEEVQAFFDTKVAIPTKVYEDLESGRISQEEVDARAAAGDFSKLVTFAALDDLPKGLKWDDGMELPEIGSPKAKKGGTWYYYEPDFPRTFRLVGPDASGTFRSYILDYTTLQLARRHPNLTEIGEDGFKYFGELAKEWSIDKKNHTIYVRLRPEAVWSDGVPITVDDYLYSLYFHMSEHLQAPWYNNYYNRNFSNFVKYDDYTFSYQIPEEKPDMTTRMLEFYPVPMHHYGVLEEDYVDKFQWKFQPTTGPYVINENDVNKGRFVRLTRNKEWWAKDLKFQRYRFNPDTLHISVIRDGEKAIESFKKGELDFFPLVVTPWWHDKVPNDDPLVQDGYIHKYTFYNDVPRPSFAIWMNQAMAPLDNQDVRIGLQHALNWDRVIDEYHRGDYVRMRSSYDGFGSFTNPNIEAREYSVEKALESFARAGYAGRNSEGVLVDENGETLSITLTTPYQRVADELTILQEEARKAGVELNLEILDLTAGFKKANEKKHQLLFAGYNTGPEMYPRLWDYYHSVNAYDRAFLPDGTLNPERKTKPNTNNIQSFADVKLDKLIEEYRGNNDANEMISIAHQAQQIVHDSASFNPSYVRPFLRAGSWRWVHWPEGFHVRVGRNLEEYFLFWIDEDEKRETLNARRNGESFEPVIKSFTTYDVYGKAKTGEGEN